MSDIDLDIATAVARIEQIAGLPEGDSLREFLLHRLVTCDAPRLRSHLSADMLAELAEALRHERSCDVAAGPTRQPGGVGAGVAVAVPVRRRSVRRQRRQHRRLVAPARVLVEVEATRRILANCEEVLNGTGWPGLAQITIRLLCLPYADQDGYREEWRP